MQSLFEAPPACFKVSTLHTGDKITKINDNESWDNVIYSKTWLKSNTGHITRWVITNHYEQDDFIEFSIGIITNQHHHEIIKIWMLKDAILIMLGVLCTKMVAGQSIILTLDCKNRQIIRDADTKYM